MKFAEVSAKAAFVEKYVTIAEVPKKQKEQCCFLEEFFSQMSKL
jgi:hypothetical protein